jgi:hypothetical protein
LAASCGQIARCSNFILRSPFYLQLPAFFLYFPFTDFCVEDSSILLAKHALEMARP